MESIDMVSHAINFICQFVYPMYLEDIFNIILALVKQVVNGFDSGVRFAFIVLLQQDFTARLI
jgi:hypothetical protein